MRTSRHSAGDIAVSRPPAAGDRQDRPRRFRVARSRPAGAARLAALVADRIDIRARCIVDSDPVRLFDEVRGLAARASR